MAEALRKSPVHCQTVLAGFDEVDGASLYWIDYLATSQKVKTAAQGY
jgi:20S proteasome subunit beta 4